MKLLKSLIATFIFAALQASCAYLETALCHGNDFHPWIADDKWHFLDARLETSGDTRDLSVVLAHYVDSYERESEPPNITAEITVSTLQKSTVYKVNSAGHFSDMTRPMSWDQLIFPLTANLGSIPAITTLHTTFEIDQAGKHAPGCIKANITPALGTRTKAVLIWGPISAFLFVLVVATCRTIISSKSSNSCDQGGRTVLPLVSDCLFYLQSIFLGSCLTLQYPGFFQPVTSNFRYYSLFQRGPLNHDHFYPSISDGIYEINGTSGGTLGFDIMHQIVGAPMTMDTWTNSVISILGLCCLAAVVLEIVRAWQKSHGHGEVTAKGSLRHRLALVLRTILSYFSFPLIAIGCYQANYIMWFPTYRTVLSFMVLALLLLIFIWLHYQLPTQILGELVDHHPREDRTSPAPSFLQQSPRIRHGGLFVTLSLSLYFVRGAAIGGLQRYPIAQLVTLILCEVTALLSTWLLRPEHLLSIRTVTILFQLVVTTLLVCFLPGMMPDPRKDAIGYVILGLHLCAMVFLFVLPSAYQLIKLLACMQSRTKPDAYGLRQLQRRHGSSANFLSGRTSSSAEGTSLSDSASLPEHKALAEAGRTPVDTLSAANRAPTFSYDRIDFRYMNKSTDSKIAPDTGTIGHLTLQKGVGRGESSKLELPDSFKVLGPHREDFTIREADFFYGTPSALYTQHTPRSPTPVLKDIKRSSILDLAKRVFQRHRETNSDSPVAFQVIRSSANPVNTIAPDSC